MAQQKRITKAEALSFLEWLSLAPSLDAQCDALQRYFAQGLNMIEAVRRLGNERVADDLEQSYQEWCKQCVTPAESKFLLGHTSVPWMWDGDPIADSRTEA